MPDSPPSKPALSPKRPYLLRALHQWMTDNDQTPHIVVDAVFPGVSVPEQHIKDGRIVLNLSYTATSHLEFSNDEIVFDARFGGTPRRLRIPLPAILGIYARESGEGLMFPADEYGSGPAPPPPDQPAPPPGRPSLKLVR